jgi:hypothetical protein
LTRRVLALAGGQDLAHDRLVHVAAFDLGALHGLLDGDRTEI